MHQQHGMQFQEHLQMPIRLPSTEIGAGNWAPYNRGSQQVPQITEVQQPQAGMMAREQVQLQMEHQQGHTYNGEQVQVLQQQELQIPIQYQHTAIGNTYSEEQVQFIQEQELQIPIQHMHKELGDTYNGEEVQFIQEQELQIPVQHMHTEIGDAHNVGDQQLLWQGVSEVQQARTMGAEQVQLQMQQQQQGDGDTNWFPNCNSEQLQQLEVSEEICALVQEVQPETMADILGPLNPQFLGEQLHQ